jgi:hypothetical protein
MRATSCTASSTRARGGSSVTCWDRYAGATVCPTTTFPASGFVSPTSSLSSDVFPAPLTPTMPIRSPGPTFQERSLNSMRGPLSVGTA